MPATTQHLIPGDIIERVLPGTGMSRWEMLEIVAVDPADPRHFCGGDIHPENYVVVRDERGVDSAMHRDWLRPELIRS